jgi:hypothetical protein
VRACWIGNFRDWTDYTNTVDGDRHGKPSDRPANYVESLSRGQPQPEHAHRPR